MNICKYLLEIVSWLVILEQRTKRVHSMAGSKGQLRPQMILQQLYLAYTSVSILLRKTSPSNIINYYSMPNGNSRAYIYILARLLKISKLPRILAVIFARKGLFQRSMAGRKAKAKASTERTRTCLRSYVNCPRNALRPTFPNPERWRREQQHWHHPVRLPESWPCPCRQRECSRRMPCAHET